MKTISFKILVATVLGLAINACAPKNNQVTAGKQFFPEEGVRTFTMSEDEESIEFSKITFFLWKPTNTPEDVKTVLLSARKIDLIEQQFPELDKQGEVIEAKVAEIDKEIVAKNEELENSIMTPWRVAKKELRAEKTKPVEDQDAEKIKALTTQIAELEAKKKVVLAEIATLEAEAAPKKLDLQAQLKVLEGKRNELNDEKSELSLQVVSTVEYRVPPSKMKFSRKQLVTLSGENRNTFDVNLLWNPEGAGEREFTTQNGLTSEMKYDTKGGQFEFVIRLSSFETYQIKVSRTGYDDKLGREIYSGDLIYKAYEDQTLTKLTETRYGVAKFSRLPQKTEVKPVVSNN